MGRNELSAYLAWGEHRFYLYWRLRSLQRILYHSSGDHRVDSNIYAQPWKAEGDIKVIRGELLVLKVDGFMT